MSLTRHRTIIVTSVVAGCLALISGDGRLLAQTPGTPMIGYQLTARWPEVEVAGDLQGIMQTPISVDAAGGQVFVSDPGVGGLHIVSPDGRYSGPIGAEGSGPEKLGAPGRLATGPTGGAATDPWQVYVLDSGTKRVVAYATDGQYVVDWGGVDSPGIGADDEGRVFVLDRELGQVVAYDPKGTEILRFGERGVGDGQYSGFVDIGVASVATEGITRTLAAVVDRDGLRIQVSSIIGDQVARVRDFNLTHPKYADCHASRVQVLDAETLFVGDGQDACILSPGAAVKVPVRARLSATVCNPGNVRIAPGRNTFLAIATLDLSDGPCSQKERGDGIEPLPAVVRFTDAELRAVDAVWPASDRSLRTSRRS